MRSSMAWVVCVVASVGCGLGNPDLQISLDAAAPATDLGLETDAGKALDVPEAPGDTVATEDRGTTGPVDLGPDAGSADDVADAAAVDAGLEDVAEKDSPGEDVPRPDDIGWPDDVPARDVPPPDVPAPDVPAPDVPAPDVPAPDVPARDVPAPDVPAPDVPAPDVPPPDVGFPINWHVTSSDVRNTDWRSGAPPNSIDEVHCGAGQLLVGLTTWSGYYVSGLAPWCAPLNADGTLGTATQGGRQGGTSGGSNTDRCPANQAIVRFDIHAGAVVDRLQATCAPIAGWLARREFGMVLRAHGDSTGGTGYVDDCPSGYMGGGFDLRDGDYNFIERVQNLRLRCVAVADH